MGYPGNDIELGRLIGSDVPLVLTRRDRARHTYAVGATRTGKTKLLEGMARQDLLAWPEHECPMVVLDPHGTLYDGLMGYAAAEGLDRWPIVPLDLRRDDLVVSYNLLRRREGIEPAVLCRSFADAILHAWGQANSNETPRLATWLFTLLMMAYERECTLAEALQIIAEPELRRRLADEVKHAAARSTLRTTQALRETEFQDRVESTLYRLNRFLATQLVRAVICQSGESLDLSAVLDSGSLLLANLSVEGTKVADEDAAALGSVLLTDLWTAARRRGKREEGGLRPCYVYIDEFQNYVTPTIARGLSEASGYGLHLTLAHQYPSQLRDQGGELGQQVLGAVLANAKNKIVFQLSHPEDLEVLTSILYRQAIDPDRIKDEIYGTKVLGHELTYLKATGVSTSRGSSTSRQVGMTRSEGHSTGRNWTQSTGFTHGLTMGESTSEGESRADGESDSASESESESVSASRQKSMSRTDSLSEGEGRQWNEVTSSTRGASSGRSDAVSLGLTFGPPTEKFQEDLRRYRLRSLRGDEREEFLRQWPLVEEMDDEEAEEFKRKWPTGASMSESTSHSTSDFTSQASSTSAGGNCSRSTGRAEASSAAEGQSLTRGTTKGRVSGRTRSTGRQTSRGRSTGHSVGSSVSQSTGRSEAWNEQVSESYAEGETTSESQTESVSWVPTLVPVLGKELSSRQFVPIEEQLFRLTQFLDGQPDRHCVVRLASMRTPAALFTRTVLPPLTTDEWSTSWAAQKIASLPFVRPLGEALRRISEREKSFRADLLSAGGADEPVTARRRMLPRPHPQ